MTAPRPQDFQVRFSNLKCMAKSPAHYLAALTGRDDSPSMRKGRALHSYLLGDSDAVLVYPGRRAGKKWEAFAEENCGREILIDSEIRDVDGMRESLIYNRDAMLLLKGQRERDIRWLLGGRACGGRPDVIGESFVTELKTCRTAQPDRFVRQALWMHYHAQLAWYRQGVRLSGLGKPQSAYVVAVESSRPYPVTVFELTQRALEQGERLCRLWFEELRGCEENDVWPGYTHGPVFFDVPDDDDGDGFTVRIDGEELEVA